MNLSWAILFEMIAIQDQSLAFLVWVCEKMNRFFKCRHEKRRRKKHQSISECLMVARKKMHAINVGTYWESNNWLARLCDSFLRGLLVTVKHKCQYWKYHNFAPWNCEWIGYLEKSLFKCNSSFRAKRWTKACLAYLGEVYIDWEGIVCHSFMRTKSSIHNIQWHLIQFESKANIPCGVKI